ncbi:hypothetical protein [Paenibacillus sp. BC26]|uniref:hypothetical protein n=1 Tax=Paenibacillus sp. BC26 TaxID=1881032 RepID=UPI0008DF524C|nr:hypothetical protein [Paenibacillus sp. BC26]SFT08911.1 hypothetical protein SAMN05428962_4297 [Paenibacillus sp. BC26]
MAACIEIERSSQWVNLIRDYVILLNDVQVGTVKDGGKAQFDIEPGEYELRLTIDWCGSNRLHFTIADGEKLRFLSSCQIRGIDYFHPFMMLYYVLYKKDQYLYVSQVQEPEPALPRQNETIEIYIAGQRYEP